MVSSANTTAQTNIAKFIWCSAVCISLKDVGLFHDVLPVAKPARHHANAFFSVFIDRIRNF